MWHKQSYLVHPYSCVCVRYNQILTPQIYNTEHLVFSMTISLVHSPIPGTPHSLGMRLNLYVSGALSTYPHSQALA